MKDVFISYSRKDEKFVQRLRDALEQREVSSWVDIDGLFVGEEFWPQICEGIDEANCLCFVLSSHSARSEWCLRELERAESGRKRVLPLVLEEPDVALAPALAERQWLWCRTDDDFEEVVEQLLQAMTHDQHHLVTHTSLLVAARKWEESESDASFFLRGRALDDAEQWLAECPGKEPEPAELHGEFLLSSRRASSKRLRRLLGSAALAFIVTLSAALIAWQERNLALNRLRDAVGVSDHIVQVLDGKLRDVPGAAAVREDLLGQSVELLDELEEGARDSTAVQVARAAGSVAQGSLAASQGDKVEALAEYKKAVELRKAVLEEDPNDPKHLRALSIAYERIGEIEIEESRYQEARAAFREALKITEQMMEADPDDEQLKTDLSYHHIDLGELAHREGDLELARAEFDRAIELRKELAPPDSRSVIRLRELSIAFSRAAGLAIEEGRMKEATNYITFDTEISARLFELNPNSGRDRLNFAITLDQLGDAARKEKEYEIAENVLRKSLELKQGLLRAEPTNTIWLYNLAVTHNKLGVVFTDAGDLRKAVEHVKADLRYTRQLLGIEGSIQAKTGYFQSLLRMGELTKEIATIREERGDRFQDIVEYDVSWSHLTLAAKVALELGEATGHKKQAQRRAASCYKIMGELTLWARTYDAAVESYQAEVELRQKIAEAGDDSSSWGEVIRSRLYLAWSYHSMAKYDEAAAELDLVEEILKSHSLETAIESEQHRELYRGLVKELRLREPLK